MWDSSLDTMVRRIISQLALNYELMEDINLKMKYVLIFIISLFVAGLIYTEFFQYKFEVNRDVDQFFFYTQIGEADWKKNDTTWGGTVPLKVKTGETFIISLEGNRTNIAKWFDVTSKSNYISLVDEQSINMKKGLFRSYKEGEAPYQMQFVYRAVESGQVKMRFQLKSPTEPGKTGDENLFINVEVKVE